MLDCWLSMDIETTVKLSQLLQPFKLKWIEDALISESINQYEILRGRIPNETLSTGEHWYGVYPFFHAASKGIIDILQPVKRCIKTTNFLNFPLIQNKIKKKNTLI